MNFNIPRYQENVEDTEEALLPQAFKLLNQIIWEGV